MNRGRVRWRPALGLRPLTARLLVARGMAEAERASRFLAPQAGRPAAARRYGRPAARAGPAERRAVGRRDHRRVRRLRRRRRHDRGGAGAGAARMRRARVAARRQPPRGLWPGRRRRRSLRRRRLPRAGHGRLRHQRPRRPAGGARARHRRHRHRSPRAAARARRRRTRWSARAVPTTPSRSRAWRRAASRSIWRRRCAPGLGASFDPRDLLDLVALGTIADMVPLVDENRILVAAGLVRLSERKRPGIAALAKRAELETGPITATDVAFRLTPRLNAAGRLGEAQLALDLLLAGRGRRRAAGHGAGRTEHGTPAHPGAGVERGAGAGGRAAPGRRSGGAGRRRRRLASRRGRHHRRAAGRPVLAAGGGDRISRRGGARLGADGRRA